MLGLNSPKVGGYAAKFADDFCGNDFRLPWPFPGPPPWRFKQEIGGINLIAAGVQIERAAADTYDSALRHALAEAGARPTQRA
jgi:hypothetical protein